MLQMDMSGNQISVLAQQKISSSVSLANILRKQRSFNLLIFLGFQSMQIIDKLANLIQVVMSVGGGNGASTGTGQRTRTGEPMARGDRPV